MIWNVPEMIAFLSRMYELLPGDLIFTGTPAGVGPVMPGDQMHGHIDGLTDLTVRVAPPLE
jgi:fumarylpyruvate hydrolase